MDSRFSRWYCWFDFSLIHAVATINFRADHIVSGTVLNLLAPSFAVFLVKAMYGKGQTDNIQQSFGKFDFPGLSQIPVIGDIFFKNTSLIGYFAIAFRSLLGFCFIKPGLVCVYDQLGNTLRQLTHLVLTSI